VKKLLYASIEISPVDQRLCLVVRAGGHVELADDEATLSDAGVEKGAELVVCLHAVGENAAAGPAEEEAGFGGTLLSGLSTAAAVGLGCRQTTEVANKSKGAGKKRKEPAPAAPQPEPQPEPIDLGGEARRHAGALSRTEAPPDGSRRVAAAAPAAAVAPAVAAAWRRESAGGTGRESKQLADQDSQIINIDD
jgi:hypothetical protein